MGDGPVVEDTAQDVYQDGDDEDKTKNTTRTDATRLVRFGVCAGVDGTRFKEVGALVRIGADKGDTGLRTSWIAIAEEGDDGGLTSDGGIRLLGFVSLRH